MLPKKQLKLTTATINSAQLGMNQHCELATKPSP